MSYSPDARQLALNVYHNSEWSIATAAGKLGVAKATLQEWLDREKAGASLEDRPRPGRPNDLSDEHRARLLELTQEHPDWTQRRYAEALNAEFDELDLDQPRICVALKRMRVSVKKNSGAPTRPAPSVSPGGPSSS